MSRLLEKLYAPSDRSIYLAVFRVYLAFHLLKKLVFQWSSLDLLYGPGAFAELGDGVIERVVDVAFFQEHFQLVAAAYAGVLVLFALGVGRHLVALAVFLFVELFQRMNGFTLNGGDNILKFFLLYMVFADSYRHLALRRTADAGETVQKLRNMLTNLAVLSIVLHLALVYFVSGVHKMHADVWFNGIATYYTLSLERFSGTDLNGVLAGNGYLVTVTTYATLLWELAFIFVVWYRKLRPWFLLAGVGLHLGIYVFMMIHDFQIIFIMTYGFFFADAVHRRVWQRVRGTASAATALLGRSGRAPGAAAGRAGVATLMLVAGAVVVGAGVWLAVEGARDETRLPATAVTPSVGGRLPDARRSTAAVESGARGLAAGAASEPAGESGLPQTAIPVAAVGAPSGGVIHGHIRRADEGPAAGAEVFVTSESEPDTMVRADDAGAYRVEGRAFDREWRLFARVPGHAPFASDPLRLTREAPDLDLDIRLQRGSSVVGRATHADGRSATGVRVRLQPHAKLLLGPKLPAPLLAPQTAAAGAAGKFEFEHLSAGAYILACEGIGAAPQVVFVDGVESVKVELAATADESSALVGFVLDDSGQPLGGAEVRVDCHETDFVRSARATSDDLGTFRLKGFGHRSVTLRASKPGHVTAIRRGVGAAEQGVVLRLDRAAAIRGRVVGPDGHAPGGRFRVAARRPDRSDELDLEPVLTSAEPASPAWVEGRADGSFELIGVPTGEIEVVAEVDGMGRGVSEVLRLGAADERTDVSVLVSPGPTIVGVVRRPGGEVVAGAKVSWTPAKSGRGQDFFRHLVRSIRGDGGRTRTDGEGRYRLSGLAPGRYALAATHPKLGPSAEVQLEVSGGGEVAAPDLILSPRSRVIVSVTERGRPVPGAVVQVIGEDSLGMKVTDAKGRIEADDLRPGSYVVIIADGTAMRSGGAMRLKSKHLELGPGATVEVKLEFGADFRVFGGVTGLDPNVRAIITLTSQAPDGGTGEPSDALDMKDGLRRARLQAGMAVVQSDGRYEMDGIAPGSYVLVLMELPERITDIAAYEMSAEPLYLAEVTVGAKELEHDIAVP